MTSPPPKTIVITGISPQSPLSTHIADLLLSHFTSTTQTYTISLALLGPSLPYLTETASKLTTQYSSASNLKILPFEILVTSAQSIGSTAHSIRASFGAADIVIHNAPAFLPYPSPDTSTQTPIRGADEDDWWEVFEVNVRSIQSVARHFFTKMREGAVFVNVLPWRDVDVHVEGQVNWEVDGKGRSAWEGSGVAAEHVMGHLVRENPQFRCHSVYVRQGGGDRGISEEEWKESARKCIVGLNCW